MRLIDANYIVDVAERAWNAWNLAMATQDTNRGVNKVLKRQELCECVKAVADKSPTIDPEDLPLVQELRAELAKVTAERDALAAKLTSIECKKNDGKLVELPCLPTDDFWWANEDDGKVYKRNSEEVIGIVVLAGGELKVLDVDGNLDPINSQYACQSEKIAEEFLKGTAQKGDSQ